MSMRPLGGALALAALVAAGGWATVISHRHSAPTASRAPIATPSPAASPTATATPAPQPPPPGIDLLWRGPYGLGDTIEAIDWSGTVRGHLVLPAARNFLGTLLPSPDGQRLLIEQNGTYTVMSAQGQVLGTFAGTPGNQSYQRIAWSDDDQHLCAVYSTETSAELRSITVDGAMRTVRRFSGDLASGRTMLAACSVSADLAVVSVAYGDDAAGHITEMAVVRLSTGAVLRDVHPPGPDLSGREPRPVPGAITFAVGSLDGRLLALQPYVAMDATTGETSIVDTLSGRVVGHVHGFVRGFTADGTAVLTDDARVDWRTGRTTATFAGCCGVVVAVHRGDAEVVVEVPSAPLPTPNSKGMSPPDPPPDLVLVRADGSEVRIACCGQTLLSG